MPIYLAHAASVNLIKIGVATDPVVRVGDLDSISPVPIVLLGSWPGILADERALHARFAHLRCRSEWFYAAPDLLDFVREKTGIDLARYTPPTREPVCGQCRAPGHMSTWRVCPQHPDHAAAE